MKIFISHSSKDKWVARTISKQLNALGTETFLDEKDIQTGESIDASIQKNLEKCDEFLILLSPASINSSWVLIELGGAIALKKHLVPVLLYIGSNEIPAPITKHLARDINDLDKYYEELKQRIEKGEKAPITLPPPYRLESLPGKNFAIGDQVRLPAYPQPEAMRTSENVDWNPDMDKFCGQVGTVIEVDTADALKVDIDGGTFWWAFEWLDHVQGQKSA